MSSRFWLLLCLALPFSATPAVAWEVIATRQATDRLAHEVIMVPGNKTFTRFKVCAERHPVRIHDLDIRFKNGSHQGLSGSRVISPGDCTHPIDLKGVTRNIVSIRLLYQEASARKRRATVQVLAE